jgi:hypothetical protein
MPLRRRAKAGCNDDTKNPPQQKAKYVSLFGSPKVPTAARPAKRRPAPMKQSNSDLASKWSSPEPRRKIPRPAAVPSAPTASTTQNLTTDRFVSPQAVARAFEFESYQRLSAASPVAATPTIQTQSPSRLPRHTDSPMVEAHAWQVQSRLPPSTVARKAPRKGSTPTPAIPVPLHGRKSQPQPRETERPRHTGGNLLALPFPLKTSQEMADERLLQAEVNDVSTVD